MIMKKMILVAVLALATMVSGLSGLWACETCYEATSYIVEGRDGVKVYDNIEGYTNFYEKMIELVFDGNEVICFNDYVEAVEEKTCDCQCGK
jgi:hypothetical protein